ncbi:NUDIX domain-containing protein [Streptomonospora nanhaiensis]|uniref:8-oxo-dGTP diphosphatase n=1 Tax=Streptomonospora nanhaiensis TaxID=1323731 RepID=A0A853BQM3_9ACTN|nr:NUDIX domain-containing protein [Streptomonospora nanhaiensis]MBV2364027.1 NUDIX domain-containing protein [Streptomonospora nanhaiensis]MBX9387371.1 NUDIX domain-containing protein [Streptomonospora nanhaiensis]NYI97025.1 8-oxo-dGTP diphosphatase [Streptomonospora nanhaiensis]
MTPAFTHTAGAEPLRGAVAIVPGPAGTLTFVLRQRGVFAGHWLLPGGCVEAEESAEQAARREAAEEAGVRAGALVPTGVYDVRGVSPESGPYWIRTHVYRALRPCPVAPGFCTDLAEVAEVAQVHWREVLPHPTDMVILNDAGAADYDPDLIRRLLAADGVTMTPLDAVLAR